MKKLLFALALTIITLTAIGYSYSCHNGGISTNCYCNCDVKFTSVTYWDNEIEKDVANITAKIIGCTSDTIKAYITNAYPCYRAYINYTIKNTGSRPVYFENLTIINPNPEALEITTTNHTGTWLQPCQKISGITTVHILQQAQQNWTYQFQIKIGLTCQEGYPRTIGFWKNQFDKALDKRGKPQVPADTLENYLDQISTQSLIYEFTGTRTEKFQNASKILSAPWYSNMEAKLKAQLLALWLNYVAGWTEGYTYKGMAAWEIIQGSETALLNHQTNKYEYWKDMCDGFNNLGGW
ncbi:MAG: hypothetical protein ACPLW8_04290 [Candidatus Bathyarchaeales archaeon]